MWKFNSMEELYHYGIPGMKWGIRRFQNRNGSLTPKGKKRYGEVTKKDLERNKRVADTSTDLVNKVKEANANTMRRTAKKQKTMDLSKMTDKEMRDQINRALLEKQYEDMFNPKTVSRGRQVANDILQSVGTGLAITGCLIFICYSFSCYNWFCFRGCISNKRTKRLKEGVKHGIIEYSDSKILWRVSKCCNERRNTCM